MAISNISAILKIAASVGDLKCEYKNIYAAKAAGDNAAEVSAIYAAEKKFVSSLQEKFDFSINVIGEENLPASGPVVYVANHQGNADILVMFAIAKHQVGFIAKENLAKVPILSKKILGTRSLFIQRDDVRASLATINEGVDLLKRGFSMVIFPEGTRSQGPEMAPFKHGSLKLATKAGVPVVPVTIDGSYKFFEQQKAVAKGTTIDVLVHAPIETANLSRDEIIALPEKIEGIVRGGLAKLQG